ncbi:MAG: response regulator transcription factor, partial [Candidatus Obscuribacterales bacterium]|nr:response regulator transcription factor [Candidatus Obscuribacterales bacterium]
MTNPSKTISVFIVEDHELMRDGIKAAIQKEESFAVVGEAGDGKDAIERVPSLAPDIVIMDIGLPTVDGIEATQTLMGTCPHTKIIMLTSHREESEVFAAFAAGAAGYCLKESASTLLKSALTSVAEGALWIDPQIAGMVLNAFGTIGKEPPKAEGEKCPLSDRELEVLKLIVEGLSNKEIAVQLQISSATVRTHVEHILEKLTVSGRTQAAVEAVRRR